MICMDDYLKKVNLTINDISYLDDTKINNLLFADDLTIFSMSKEVLQK